MGPCLPDWPLVLVEILARGLLNGCRGVLLCYQINFLVKNSVMGDVCVCVVGALSGVKIIMIIFSYTLYRPRPVRYILRWLN